MSYSNLLEEVSTLVALHPRMHLVEQVTDLILEGTYEYNLTYGGAFIIGSRWLRLVVNKDFPDTLPKLFFGTIPSGMSHFYMDSSACVATIGELVEFTAKSPSLLKYWDKFVNAFIFTAHWFSEYGKYPFGDREHGAPGVLNYYEENWGISTVEYLQLIRLIKKNQFRGHHLCFCGSGLKLRDCHGKRAAVIMSNEGSRKMFLEEANFIYQENK